jgi:hypothetical protein
LCKSQGKLLSDRREEFTARGIKLIGISAVPDNIEEFRANAWPDDDLYIDEGLVFKEALGGRDFKNRWLLNPKVILAIAKNWFLGNQSNDMNEKTNKMGGTIVVKDQAVVLSQAEGSDFGYASPETIFSSVE